VRVRGCIDGLRVADVRWLLLKVWRPQCMEICVLLCDDESSTNPWGLRTSHETIDEVLELKLIGASPTLLMSLTLAQLC
jgi:hypothetical protein